MKILFISFLLLSFTGNAQEIILEEKFEQGIPKDWTVKTDNSVRKWYAKSYKSDFYVTMSAFGGKGKKGHIVKSDLHTPLYDLRGKDCKMKFSFADAYQNGQPLHVYITDEKFNLVKQINDDYWSSFVNNKGRYDNHYEATEWIPLPKLELPYRINFSYQSQRDEKIITTTIQLKDVDIWCTE